MVPGERAIFCQKMVQFSSNLDHWCISTRKKVFWKKIEIFGILMTSPAEKLSKKSKKPWLLLTKIGTHENLFSTPKFVKCFLKCGLMFWVDWNFEKNCKFPYLGILSKVLGKFVIFSISGQKGSLFNLSKKASLEILIHSEHAHINKETLW